MSPIPFTDFNGSGPSLHFLHANGYPPACYRPLMEILQSRFHVTAMHLRPLWPDAKPDELNDWHPLSDDFLRFLADHEAGPVIGVGHSVGGITVLRAALRDPTRFRGIVLLDPVLFPPSRILAWRLARTLGIAHRAVPLMKSALQRRRVFDSREMIYAAYRRRANFRNFSDESLRAYIEGMTRPRAQGGFELVQSPEWEARIYYTGIWRDFDLWRGLKGLRVPTLILRGAQTDTFWAETAARVRRANPEVRVEALEGAGHLIPLEKPQEVGQSIIRFADEVSPKKDDGGKV